MSTEEADLLVAYWDEEECRAHQIVRVHDVVLIQETQIIRGKVTRRSGITENVEIPVSTLMSSKNINHISHPIWRQL